jgi:class 3 adenylate cyclase/tetratricopeptide (TPR) repeat protein
MQCPQCHSENDEGKKYCRSCGAKLRNSCPDCGTPLLPGDKFCGECGLDLTLQESHPGKAPTVITERRQVTALFVDVTGYTALAEKLDPEEVKDIMGHLFGNIGKIISTYEGFIEKFAGDAVLAIFGVPRSHEDDPIRAIKTAQAIHRAMAEISREVHERIGQPLSVHIGINSGLVVTAEFDLKKGTQHVAGDTINVASRLCNLAKANETLVGHATYAQAEGFFAFEPLEPFQVKGRTRPVQAYRLVSPMELPRKTHRISGQRANLIGRKAEMAQLGEAVDKLLQGQGSVISVCGESGTGKSRLIEEFKSSLDLEAIQWLEGQAYAYTRNIPYYPLTDLLNRTFHIEESDPPDTAREKAEREINALVNDRKSMLPYVGGLLSIPYPEADGVSPDVWKARLHKAILTLFSALVRRAPTIINLEDLHWADPSSLELLRFLLAETQPPALFLCVYRPSLGLLSPSQVKEMGDAYREVRLGDLSPSETRRMVSSLLRTEAVPGTLLRIIQEKVGGNPFYVEEVINTLIESGTLARADGGWQFPGVIQEIILPPTIQGIITARLDRLDAASRMVLQEASVIGRTFYYEVLKKITGLGGAVDHHLQKLEELDLIRVISTHPDIEYSFKHVLIQECVYNGLLKKERKNIHERIGLALEEFFRERASESWETLAFHFKRGRSVSKAVDYLAKSGEKSLKLYALEEAHQYYKEAFEMLLQEHGRSKTEDAILIDILLAWCLVFYYSGRFKAMAELLLANMDLAESLHDKAKVGVFYAWLGYSYFGQGANLEDSYRYLRKSLKLGEQTRDPQVIAYACAFMIKTCAEMGHLEEAADFEARTREMIGLFPLDAFLHMHYFSGKGYIGWFSGNKTKLYEAARGLLDYGQDKGSLRCQMAGYCLMGVRHLMDLDMEQAVECARKVLTLGDPYHILFGRVLLGMFLVHMREFKAAEDHLIQVIENSEKHGTEYLKTFANMFLGVAQAAQGDLREGFGLIERSSQEFLNSRRNILYCLSEYILGGLYLQILQRSSGGRGLSFYLRNLGFLVKNAPYAGKKAEKHLTKAVELAELTNAQGFLGQPLMQLGLLFKLKGKTEKSRQCLADAIRVFTDCGLEAYAQRAGELLESLASPA